METQNEYEIPQREFDTPSQEGLVLAEMPGEAEYAASAKGVSLPKWGDGRDALPVLTAEQERHLFRKMNYLKRRSSTADAQPTDLPEARAIRDRLIRANLKLLFRILKRYDSTAAGREDLVSDGELGLWRAVEKFDYSRGRFSTFATKVIRRRLNARVGKAARHKDLINFGDQFLRAGDSSRAEVETRQSDSPDFGPLLDTLPTREREVVLLRHGFGEIRGKSLLEVADELGISKTRARQLEQQAYARLRQSAELIAC
jgi:RNA polymerase sigma factor (sigma-70 family)